MYEMHLPRGWVRGSHRMPILLDASSIRFQFPQHTRLPEALKQMSGLINAHNLGYLVVLLMVVITVRGRSPGSFSMLVASLILIGLAIGHVFASDVFKDSISLMGKHGRISSIEAEVGRTATNQWDVIISLLLGGMGVNLFCGWLTSVPSTRKQGS